MVAELCDRRHRSCEGCLLGLVRRMDTNEIADCMFTALCSFAARTVSLFRERLCGKGIYRGRVWLQSEEHCGLGKKCVR